MEVGAMESAEIMFEKLCAGDVAESVFIDALRAQGAPLPWLRRQLEIAYEQGDGLKAEYLLSCTRLRSFRERSDTADVLRLYCEMMVDPRFSRSAESIADALAYCDLDKEALPYFVTLCTSEVWLREPWPDLRHAVDTIYGFHESGTCSKAETVRALETILRSPVIVSEGRGIREAAQAYLAKLQAADESGEPSDAS